MHSSSPALIRLRRPHVLVVEDDPEQFPIIERAARAACPDVAIHWATDAASAVDVLEKHWIDLVLADYTLEDSENGWWVLSECRRIQPQARIALDSALPLRLPEWAECPFLRKPFSTTQCREFLARYLG